MCVRAGVCVCMCANVCVCVCVAAVVSDVVVGFGVVWHRV